MFYLNPESLLSLPQVRLNSEQERFLIVPFGLLYSEVTASSLVKLLFCQVT